MKCKYVLRQLSRYVDRDLSDEIETEISLHFLDCDSCKAEMEAFQESRDVLSGIGEQDLTSPAMDTLQKNVRSQVHRESMRHGAVRALENNRTSWAFTLTTAMAAATILCVAGVYLAYVENYSEPQSAHQVVAPGGTTAAGNPLGTGSISLSVPVRPDLVETLYSIEGARSVGDVLRKGNNADAPDDKSKSKQRRPIRAKLVTF